MKRYRVGRKVGRTIYRQSGPQPSDYDVLVGVMDTPELAARAVQGLNAATEPHGSRVAAEPRSLLTVEQFAARVGIGRSRAYDKVRTGEIESVKDGRLRRIPVEAVDRYVERLLTREPEEQR